jgi:hypothetical protein
METAYITKTVLLFLIIIDLSLSSLNIYNLLVAGYPSQGKTL